MDLNSLFAILGAVFLPMGMLAGAIVLAVFLLVSFAVAIDHIGG